MVFAFLLFNYMEQHTPRRVLCSSILRLNSTNYKMFAARFDNLGSFSTCFHFQPFFLYYSSVNHQKKSMDRSPNNSFYFDLKCYRFQFNDWSTVKIIMYYLKNKDNSNSNAEIIMTYFLVQSLLFFLIQVLRPHSSLHCYLHFRQDCPIRCLISFGKHRMRHHLLKIILLRNRKAYKVYYPC